MTDQTVYRRHRGRPPEPYHVRSLRPKRDRRHWLSLGSSFALHSVLFILAAGVLTREVRKEAGPHPARLFDPGRQVQMVFVAPSPRREPPAPRPPATPTAPGPTGERSSAGRFSPTPEPEPNATAEEKPREATAPPTAEPETPETAPPRSETAAAPTPLAEAAPAPAASQESEARRIFGRPRAQPGEQNVAESVRPFETTSPGGIAGCPVFSLSRNNPSEPAMGAVAGRIFRQDNGKPLAGAHLQIIGTRFGTFSNDRGEYVLTFEVALLDHCRTQYVRVTAPGYEARVLVLLAGRDLPSDDVLLRRQ